MGEAAARDGNDTTGRPGAAGGRVRRLAFSSLALLFALVWLYLGFGIIDLSYVIHAVAPADEPTPRDVSHEVAVLEVAYGAVATFLVAGAFLRQVVGPTGWPAATQQIVVLVLAFGLAGVVGLDVLSFISVVTLVVMQGTLLALYPGRPRPSLVPALANTSPRVAVVAAFGALPWTLYVWHMSANSRAGLVPEEQALRPQAGGWAGAALLGLTVVLLAWLAATRTPGWRLPLWTTVAAVLAFAAIVVRYPTFPGSPGRLWGLLAALWALVLLVVAEVESFRDRRHALMKHSSDQDR